MKRKILLLAAVAACAAITAVGTLAYFSADNTAHNVITTGGVNIEIVEQMKDGDTLVDFPEEGIIGVMPGTSVSKIVQVKNTDASDAWIRASVSMSLQTAEGSELPLVLTGGEDVITFTVMDGWIDGGGGYYYYREALKPDDMTEPLFAAVNFDPGMDNRYQNSTAKISVTAHAVQAANNGDNIMDAKGWPEE